MWTQRFANGKTVEFEPRETTMVDGNWGTIVRRLPDRSIDFFIPDVHALGRDPWLVRFRAAPNGVWQGAGEMHVTAISAGSVGTTAGSSASGVALKAGKQ